MKALQRASLSARPNPSATAMPAIAVSRTRALDDSDGATRQTVEKMCELIRESTSDPYVQRCAAYARDRFAMGSTDQAALAWGVFWYVKHCVKFRLDEGTMLQIGESHDAYGQQQQDLLIAPAVLVRMKDPSEDCDGFTMLTAALLTCLGVRVLIATVAVDMDDPSRWSHVFLCAIINGRVKPLDTSHGTSPGWMVPRNRINRWQTWTLDGRPADVSIPTFQGLHAYTAYPGLGQATRGRRRIPVPVVVMPRRGRGFGGLGQADCFCDDGSDGSSGTCDDGTAATCGSSSSSVDLTSGASLNPFGFVSPGAPANTPGCPAGYTLDSDAGGCTQYTCDSGYTLTTSGVCISTTGQTQSPIPGATTTPNYAALVGSIANAAGQDIKAVIQQPQALLNAQTWANLSAYLPIIGVGVLGVILVSSLAGKK